jgi:hypothetical protein
MQPRYLLALLFLALLPCLGACGKGAQKKKKLTDAVRPLQLGTEIGVGSDSFAKVPEVICSFGFYAERTDLTPAPEGLVTALHCANMLLTENGGYQVVNREPIWQSRPTDSRVIARVAMKPKILKKGEAYRNFYCPKYWRMINTAYCVAADAVFADLSDGVKTLPGAVANVPLSIKKTKITLNSESEFDLQSGVLADPIPGEIVYKIGRTTGKTRLYVVGEDLVVLVRSKDGRHFNYLRLFKAVDMWEDPAPQVDQGDSGGPVFHNFRNAHDGYILVGITAVSAIEDGSEVLYIEPVSDIKRMLPVEPEYAGSGGAMHAGEGR